MFKDKDIPDGLYRKEAGDNDDVDILYGFG